MKEKIINNLKFAVFLWVTFLGVFTAYALVWVGLGLPIDWWTSFVVIALSALFVWAYVKWLET